VRPLPQGLIARIQGAERVRVVPVEPPPPPRLGRRGPGYAVLDADTMIRGHHELGAVRPEEAQVLRASR
jgi:hypothetical protein